MSEQALVPGQARDEQGGTAHREQAATDLGAPAQLEWAGYLQAPEQLASCCLPAQPVVDKLLRLAGELLKRNGHDATLHGYEAADASRLGLQAVAVWNVLLGLRLDALAAPAPLAAAQRLRSPEQIVQTRSAGALDCALLCCALLERMGLHPLLVLEDEHAYAGLWMQAERFPQVCGDDVLLLRKRVQLKDILLFDSALLSRGVAFKDAMRAAQQRLTVDERFVMVLDLATARAHQLRPFGTPLPQADSLEVLDAPDMRAPAVGGDELAPTTPLGRLEQWQRRLLDLSLRNPLLSLRDSRTAIPILAPIPRSSKMPWPPDRRSPSKRCRRAARTPPPSWPASRARAARWRRAACSPRWRPTSWRPRWSSCTARPRPTWRRAAPTPCSSPSASCAGSVRG